MMETKFVTYNGSASVAARISVRGGGEHLGGRPRGGPGGRSPPPGRQKILKISKKLLKKMAKKDYFRRFFKKIKKLSVKFWRF